MEDKIQELERRLGDVEQVALIHVETIRAHRETIEKLTQAFQELTDSYVENMTEIQKILKVPTGPRFDTKKQRKQNDPFSHPIFRKPRKG